MHEPTLALDRRSFLGAAGALPLLRPAVRLPVRAASPVLVGSANALAGMRTWWPRLEAGADPLDCALGVVDVVEADPDDDSVGLGGLPNEDGVVQLDAACMHGPTHNSGAVACIENILHPSAVARLVMERTDHCMLVGRGEYEFARAHGHPHVELLTEASRQAWMRWKETMSDRDDRLPPPAPPEDEKHGSLELDEHGVRHTTGTVHCSALSAAGEVACTTTTSGLSWKIPGRVGDSPIVGAGLYCDMEAGSAGATGRGEAAILANGSFACVELMRGGMAPEAAGLEVLRRIARQAARQASWQPGLLDADGRPAFDVHFYLVGLDGRFAGVTMRERGRSFAVAERDGGPRLAPLVPLYGG
jgi:N4-(beta-N-acetylglucosaminyl)-L-asparaginase